MSILVFADSVDCSGPWLTGTEGYWGAETRRPGDSATLDLQVQLILVMFGSFG